MHCTDRIDHAGHTHTTRRQMAGYFKGAVGKEMPQRGDCYFLNNTVAPIYKVVCDGSK